MLTQPQWAAADWDADPDWDWHSATADTPERLRSMWTGSVARSRAMVTDALAIDGETGE